MSIEINTLETQRFGVTCARLEKSDEPLEAAMRMAKARGVDMLSTRVDVSDLPRVHALEEAGFRLMDTLLYVARTLDGTLPSMQPTQGVHLRMARPEDAERATVLARKGFEGYFGHYHADPRLDGTAADAAYVEWAENSLATLSDENPVLLAELDECVVGFLTLRRVDEELELVLSAVDTACQGKGIYRTLIAGALPRAKAMGAKRVVTSTQINNYAVQRVWSRLGFVHDHSVYTLHAWLTGDGAVQ